MKEIVCNGDLLNLLNSTSDSLRFAAARIRSLEKQASDQRGELRSTAAAKAFVEAGLASTESDAKQMLKKLASMDPVDVARTFAGGGLGMFVDGAEADAPTERNQNRLLDPQNFLEELRS